MPPVFSSLTELMMANQFFPSISTAASFSLLRQVLSIKHSEAFSSASRGVGVDADGGCVMDAGVGTEGDGCAHCWEDDVESSDAPVGPGDDLGCDCGGEVASFVSTR